jgi:hypothetical protein
MILMLKIPLFVEFYVIGPTRESLDQQTDFDHRVRKQVLHCRMRIIGNENDEQSLFSGFRDGPHYSEQLPEDSRHFRHARYLELSISEESPENILALLIAKGSYDELTKILRSIANRCLQAMRNFGRVPHLHELYGGDDEDYALILRGWNVQFSHDNKTWEPVIGAVYVSRETL